MDQAVQLLQTFGTQLMELARQVGPEVFALAMGAIMVQHLGALFLGFGMVLFGAAMWFPARKFWNIAEVMKAKANSNDDGWRWVYFLSVCIACLGAIIASIGLFDHLLDIWNWAIIYDPRLYIAKKALGL